MDQPFEEQVGDLTGEGWVVTLYLRKNPKGRLDGIRLRGMSDEQRVYIPASMVHRLSALLQAEVENDLKYHSSRE